MELCHHLGGFNVDQGEKSIVGECRSMATSINGNISALKHNAKF
jgi:hypothetical protein